MNRKKKENKIMGNSEQKSKISKSEILFLYDGTFTVPNGDPFTGEQRYDDETKKILVSDVRIKRYVRDYLAQQGHEIFVSGDAKFFDKSLLKEKEKASGASVRMKTLKAANKGIDSEEVAKKCIDIRLFGGISTEKGDTFNFTGPVQFALLNPSLNSADLRMHQNTSVFASDTEKKQGAIGTTTVVPYCINQIHGWINSYSALETDLTEEDIQLMFTALWNSVNNANTRSKSNQNSILLLRIIYSNDVKKVYGLDRTIMLKSEKQDEQLRSFDDCDLDLSALEAVSKQDIVAEIQYYTEIPKLIEILKTFKKFKAMSV